MTCKKGTAKKYGLRNSPPFPAQDCKGTKKKGKDELLYVSVKDKRGIYRWKKTGTKKTGTKKTGTKSKTKKVKKTETETKKTEKMSPPTSYFIHDNGGQPYVVDVSAYRVIVVRLDPNKNRGEIIYETEYDQIWLGDNLLSDPNYLPRGRAKGNSILLKSGEYYVYIGHVIYQFEASNDTINAFYSPIGNSDVPYPYAVGEEYTYFFLDKKRVLTSLLDPTKDGYTQFYGIITASQKKGFSTHGID